MTHSISTTEIEEEMRPMRGPILLVLTHGVTSRLDQSDYPHFSNDMDQIADSEFVILAQSVNASLFRLTTYYL